MWQRVKREKTKKIRRKKGRRRRTFLLTFNAVQLFFVNQINFIEKNDVCKFDLFHQEVRYSTFILFTKGANEGEMRQKQRSEKGKGEKIAGMKTQTLCSLLCPSVFQGCANLQRIASHLQQ